MFYLTHTPWWLKKIYPTCIWDIPVNDKSIFITFDDGPHPEATPFVLERLKQYEAKGTFFCIGKNVAAHPSIFETIKKEGHALGNHTMHHANGWQTANEIYIKEISDANILIDTHLFRPPYGRIKKAQIKELQRPTNGISTTYKIIMWSVLSGDFDTGIDGEKCFQNVIRSVRPGSIIVFHDSAKALPRLQYALPKLLNWLKENNYITKPIVL